MVSKLVKIIFPFLVILVLTFILGLYSDLILSGTLPEYLIEIDKTANERAKSIINELAKEEKVDENLKQNNQLEWVRCMNNIKNRTEEIVLNELIYC